MKAFIIAVALVFVASTSYAQGYRFCYGCSGTGSSVAKPAPSPTVEIKAEQE